MGIVTALSATALAAGLAVTGVYVAEASPAPASPAAAGFTAASPAAAGITLPAGGVLEQRVTKFCGRVPNLIVRDGKAQTRLSGDADTKGSLAWLKAKQAKATANKHPQVVRRLDRVIERRTERLAKLPSAQLQLKSAQQECGTLDLPTPTPSASTS